MGPFGRFFSVTDTKPLGVHRASCSGPVELDTRVAQLIG